MEGHEDRELEKLIEDMVRRIVSRPAAEEPEGGTTSSRCTSCWTTASWRSVSAASR